MYNTVYVRLHIFVVHCVLASKKNDETYSMKQCALFDVVVTTEPTKPKKIIGMYRRGAAAAKKAPA